MNDFYKRMPTEKEHQDRDEDEAEAETEVEDAVVTLSFPPQHGEE